MDTQKQNKTQLKHSGLVLLLGGALVALCLTALYFASQAARYSKDFVETKESMDLVEKKLKLIEAMLGKIDVYGDAIDDVTMTAIGAGHDPETTAKLDQVDQLIEEVKRVGSELTYDQDVSNRLEDIVVKSERAERTLSGLVLLLKHHRDVFKNLPTITPAEGWISSGFGKRISPFTGDQVEHLGLDIGADIGAPVYATADGVIEFVGHSDTFGNLVVIKHANDIWTRYAHNSKTMVSKGQTIKRGQKIALVGSTGRSTGPHLHYEVWVNRKPVDPRTYLLDQDFNNIDLATISNGGRQLGGEEFHVTDPSHPALAIENDHHEATEFSKPAEVVAQKVELSEENANWRKSLGSALVGLALVLAAFMTLRSLFASRPQQLNLRVKLTA